MYLIIGANGFLGTYIVKNVIENTNEDIIATTRNKSLYDDEKRIKWIEFNVENNDEVDELWNNIKKIPDIKVIYLAAYHHPDKVEKNKSYAWSINITALSHFLEKTIDSKVKTFVYASTDSVYGESVDGYRFKEKDALNPVNFYGKCKCAAEALVTNAGFSVVRFPFLISPSLSNKPHFYDEIVNTLKNNMTIEMFEDSFRSSLSFDNAAFLLVKYIESKKCGTVLNICGDKALSKYEVGLMIANNEKLKSELVKPVKSSIKLENFETPRAKTTLMDNSLLKSILNVQSIDIFDKPVFD